MLRNNSTSVSVWLAILTAMPFIASFVDAFEKFPISNFFKTANGTNYLLQSAKHVQGGARNIPDLIQAFVAACKVTPTNNGTSGWGVVKSYDMMVFERGAGEIADPAAENCIIPYLNAFATHFKTHNALPDWAFGVIIPAVFCFAVIMGLICIGGALVTLDVSRRACKFFNQGRDAGEYLPFGLNEEAKEKSRLTA